MTSESGHSSGGTERNEVFELGFELRGDGQVRLRDKGDKLLIHERESPQDEWDLVEEWETITPGMTGNNRPQDPDTGRGGADG